MAEGYVCLWRSAIESEFFHDEWLCKLWMWCMCRANYKEQEWKGEVIPAGSFITGRHAAADALRVTESKFYRGLKRLENMRMIVTKSNNRFTVVTLCNWKTYQQPDSDKRTTDEQPANNKRTTGEQPANTGEEGKKEIREEGNNKYTAVLQDVLREWNKTAGVVKARSIEGKRATAIRQRLEDGDWPWQEALKKFPLKLHQSDPEGWQPTLDWFARPETVNRILEGYYDWRKNGKQQSTIGSGQRHNPDDDQWGAGFNLANA